MMDPNTPSQDAFRPSVLEPAGPLLTEDPDPDGWMKFAPQNPLESAASKNMKEFLSDFLALLKKHKLGLGLALLIIFDPNQTAEPITPQHRALLMSFFRPPNSFPSPAATLVQNWYENSLNVPSKTSLTHQQYRASVISSSSSPSTSTSVAPAPSQPQTSATAAPPPSQNTANDSPIVPIPLLPSNEITPTPPSTSRRIRSIPPPNSARVLIDKVAVNLVKAQVKREQEAQWKCKGKGRGKNKSPWIGTLEDWTKDPLSTFERDESNEEVKATTLWKVLEAATEKIEAERKVKRARKDSDEGSSNRDVVGIGE